MDAINVELPILQPVFRDPEPIEGIVLEANKGYYYQYQTYLLPVFSSHEITKPLLGNYQILLGNAQAVKETEDIPNWME